MKTIAGKNQGNAASTSARLRIMCASLNRLPRRSQEPSRPPPAWPAPSSRRGRRSKSRAPSLPGGRACRARLHAAGRGPGLIDCHTKEVIGWATDDNYKTPLIEKAIEMAARNYPLAEGAIFHSDRGSNYQCHLVKLGSDIRSHFHRATRRAVV